MCLTGLFGRELLQEPLKVDRHAQCVDGRGGAEYKMDEEARVSEWVRKTGFPLEMKVANAFRASDCLVATQGVPYVDLESDKVRECDVLATWQAGIGGHLTAFHFVVECKGKTGLPWVAFSSGTKSSDRSTSVNFRAMYNLGGPVGKNIDPDVQNLIRRAAVKSGGGLLQESRSTVYAISQSLREKSNKRDLAYDAARQALASATGLCADAADTSPENGAPFMSYWFPVVVTEDALYECTPGKSGEPEVSPVEYIRVPVKIEGAGEQRHVRVLNLSYLDPFVAKCSSTSKHLVDASLADRDAAARRFR